MVDVAPAMLVAFLPKRISAPPEKPKYTENLILKGGSFLYPLTDFDSRVTTDVDFLLRKMPNTPERIYSSSIVAGGLEVKS